MESVLTRIPIAFIEPAFMTKVLIDVVTISPILMYPKLPPINNEFTVREETTN